MSVFKPKTKILFPNKWAADSFLLKLKRSSGWTYLASDGGKHIRIQPTVGAEYVLLNVVKTGAGIHISINAEKCTHGGGARMESFWNNIFSYARLYRS